MAELQWAHAIGALLGAIVGAGSGVFTAGWWFGRIETRLKLNVQSTVGESEKRIEDKVELARQAFDETLKGLRQKINDTDQAAGKAQLEAERRFMLKDDFNDFRQQEYRQDMQRIFEKLDTLLTERSRA